MEDNKMVELIKALVEQVSSRLTNSRNLSTYDLLHINNQSQQ